MPRKLVLMMMQTVLKSEDGANDDAEVDNGGERATEPETGESKKREGESKGQRIP